MAERLCCWEREEAKRKWHDKVTASSQAASEKSRKKQQKQKVLVRFQEDLKEEVQRQFPFLIHTAVTLSKVRPGSK